VPVRHTDDFLHYGRLVQTVVDEERKPVFLMVDEAQMVSASRKRKESIGDASDLMNDFMERGRKRSLDVFVTAHRFSGTLHRSVFANKNLTLIGRQEDPTAWSALAPQFKGSAIGYPELAALAPGEFFCFSRRGVEKVQMPMAEALAAVAPKAKTVRQALPATFSQWDRAMREISTERLKALDGPVCGVLGAIVGLTPAQLLAGHRARRDELEARMTSRTWQQFVACQGIGARAYHLSAIVGQPLDDIIRARHAAPVPRTPAPSFAEMFADWHGRGPRDDEWPAPRIVGGGYEWLAPELALLARLVGRVDIHEIVRILTARLRAVTCDPRARRGHQHVQGRINRIGLQTGGDLVGGLTTKQAANRVGRLAVVHAAIKAGHLPTFRVGKRHVIPREAFERWLATREEPPVGYVRLASLCGPLGISSDSKLPKYAALGHIPGAVKVAGIATKRGLWFVPADLARQILEDAKAGRKLPWHGKPLPSNQQAMWRKYQRRKHHRCRRCAEIWRGRAPQTFEAFAAKYGDLSLGEKRHVTIDRSKDRRGSAGWRGRGTVVNRMRAAGVTVYEAARALRQPTKWLRRLIRSGFLEDVIVRDALGGEAVRITDAGMAMLRGIADGEAAKRASGEWIGLHAAAQLAGVSITTLQNWRARYRAHDVMRLRTRPGGRGAEYEVESLKACARTYWAWAVRRFHRAAPPAWLQSRRSEAA
jgi:hypothetical protein